MNKYLLIFEYILLLSYIGVIILYLINADKKFDKAEKIRDFLYPFSAFINIIPILLLFIFNDWYISANMKGIYILFLPLIFAFLGIADYRHYRYYLNFKKKTDDKYFGNRYIAGLYGLVFFSMLIYVVVMGITHQMI